MSNSSSLSWLLYCIESRFTNLETRVVSLVRETRVETLSKLEPRVSRVEMLAKNTGRSLARICENIDGKQETDGSGSDTYHCCVNREDNKLDCATTSIARGLEIDMKNGDNTCDTTNKAKNCLPDKWWLIKKKI